MRVSDELLKMMGDFFKEKRKLAGWTQMEVAKEFGYTTAQFISNWERGLILPPMTTIRELVKMYEIPMKELEDIWVKFNLMWLREICKQSNN